MAVFYPTKRLYSVHNSNDDKDSNLHDTDDRSQPYYTQPIGKETDLVQVKVDINLHLSPLHTCFASKKQQQTPCLSALMSTFFTRRVAIKYKTLL